MVRDEALSMAMQDAAPVHCFGCGTLNEHGLRIKSFWAGDEVVCAWRPKPHHIGHPGILYGGLIASVIDCHSIWAAAAHAHRAAGLAMERGTLIPYVTASLAVSFRKPVPIDSAVELRARVVEFGERKARVTCSVTAKAVLCAEAEVVAVRIGAA
jgi:acyl-coenzyme A thioesterase PaaI-like protein